MSASTTTLPAGTSWLRRYWWIVASVVAVAGVGTYVIVAKPFAAKLVTIPIERRLLRESLEVSGTVESRQAVTLRAEASGPVRRLAVQAGTRVSARSPLLIVDPDAARLQLAQVQQNTDAQIAQTATELAGARTALAEARQRRTLSMQGLNNEVARARTALAQAERDAATSERLVAAEAVSQQSAQLSRTQLEQARIALKTALDAVHRADTDQTEIISARNRLRTAETAAANARKQGMAAVAVAAQALSKTTLLAPFAGTVTDWLVGTGDYVGPATPVATFQDLADLVLNLPVDEIDVPKMRQGGPVTITFDSYPDRQIAGQILRIGTASSAVKDVMVFPVEVRFANANGAIKPGMSGDAEILLAEHQDAVAIPIAAVQRDKGRYFVQVKTDAPKPIEKTFQPGIVTFDYIEALSGIKPGDLVVIPADKATGAK